MKRHASTVGVVAAMVLAAPLLSHATVIGVVYPECCEAYEKALKSLKMELARGGYGAGDAEIYEQKPSSDAMSWSNAFRKFVGVDADLIIVFGDDMLEIACRERTKIPVLFGFVDNPTSAKCIDSNEQPGSNVTGVSGHTPVYTLLEKSLKIKKFNTLGLFDLAGDTLSSATLREIRSHSGELGFSVVVIPATNRKGLSEALEGSPAFDVLFFPNFSAGIEEVKEIARVADSRKVPVISLRPPEAGARSLLSLYPDPEEQGRLMGAMALKLLKGDKPSSTSVQSPKRIELEIDLTLARQYGLKIPMAVLKSATKVTK
jgi:putative ABC transport system substrate-binding protein